MNLNFLISMMYGIIWQLVFPSSIWAIGEFQQDRQEHIIDISKANTATLEKNLILSLFKKISIVLNYRNNEINFNPLAALSLYFENPPKFRDYSTLQSATREISTVFIGQRTIKTQIPISVFRNLDFNKAEIQNQIFTEVKFYDCTLDTCKAEQKTALGNAKYDVYFKFLTMNILKRLELPTELLPPSEINRIHYAMVQYAFNWNDFFSSGLNLTLIQEDHLHNSEITAYQIFLLTPHFLSDTLYKTNISYTIDNQTQNFIDYISKASITSSATPTESNTGSIYEM
jgi:hypothetical protein